jgi:hypothetical protein
MGRKKIEVPQALIDIATNASKTELGKLLAKSTVDTRIATLRRVLEDPSKPIESLNNYKRNIKYVRDHEDKLSVNTRLTWMTSLVMASLRNAGVSDAAKTAYEDEMNRLQTQSNKKKLEDNPKKEIPEWTELKEAAPAETTKKPRKDTTTRDNVIRTFYTALPPRRISDLSTLVYYKSRPSSLKDKDLEALPSRPREGDSKAVYDSDGLPFNFVVIDEHIMVLRNYKTSQSSKVAYTTDLPQEIIDAIVAHVADSKIPEGHVILNGKQTVFNNLSPEVKRIFGGKGNVNTLRKSAVNLVHKEAQSDQMIQARLAKSMGHSLATATMTYRTHNKPSEVAKKIIKETSPSWNIVDDVPSSDDIDRNDPEQIRRRVKLLKRIAAKALKEIRELTEIEVANKRRSARVAKRQAQRQQQK